MVGMVPQMMQGDKHEPIMVMMTKCLGMMLQNMQNNDRIAFILRYCGKNLRPNV